MLPNMKNEKKPKLTKSKVTKPKATKPKATKLKTPKAVKSTEVIKKEDDKGGDACEMLKKIKNIVKDI
jgi:hypothetical protein